MKSAVEKSSTALFQLFLINCKLMVETINVDPNETDTFQAVSLVEVKLTTSESWMATTLTQPGLTDTTSASLTFTTSAFETAYSTTFTTTSIEMTTLTTPTTEHKLLLDDGSFHLLNDSFGPDGKTGLHGEVVPVLGNGSFREDLDDKLQESYPNARNRSISRQQLEHIRSLTGRNISELGQDAMCSSTVYCELSKQNSDYPKFSPQQQKYMCLDKNDVAKFGKTRSKIQNCKYSDPQNFNFVNKGLCIMFEEQMTILQDFEHHNTGLECYFALICDSILPEGCGFLTNRFSIWLIVFSTLLK